jgi:hypothetical protein
MLLAIDHNLDRHGAIGGKVLVLGKGKAAAAAVATFGTSGPAEPLGRGLHDGAGAAVRHMGKAEGQGIGAGGLRQLVHEALDGEDIHVRAE